MVIKAALFSFNGIILNDEDIRQTLSEEVLLAENLRPDQDDYREVCLGRSDRACLSALLSQRGRNVNEATLDKLLTKESATYQAWLETLEKLPIYPGLEDLIFRCRAAQLKMAVVTGAERPQVVSALEKADLSQHFPVMVTGSEISADGSKPAPDGYLKVIEALNEANEDLQLTADECIAIEATFAGIEAAKNAQISVIGVAHTYPHHMLQRRATWVVDYLREINFDWIGEKFGGDRISTEEATEAPSSEAPDNASQDGSPNGSQDTHQDATESD